MTKEHIKSISDTIDKTEDDFEKKIIQISTGALAISLTFIDKIVNLSNAVFFWLLITGWILLTVTIAINLISILISRQLSINTIKDKNKEIDENLLIENIDKRNYLIQLIDYISLSTLILGIFGIVIFSSINITNKVILKENIINNKIMKKEKGILKNGRTVKTTVISKRPEEVKDEHKKEKKEKSDKK